jgi:hypothetical protein
LLWRQMHMFHISLLVGRCISHRITFVSEVCVFMFLIRKYRTKSRMSYSYFDVLVLSRLLVTIDGVYISE